MTLKRSGEIRSAGYNLIEMYECEFIDQINSNPALKAFMENEFDVPKRMGLRDAFVGGRTSVFKLYHECVENEEIHFCDVVSLYPFINKHSKQPVGHPEIITRNFDMTMESYFGLAHVKILPPKDLYVPCIPVRHGGKLTFPLCRTCLEQEINEGCTHTDSERVLTGAWCTPEIMAALARGYKIIKIYEVYHFPNFSQYDPETGTGGLFTEQVNLFLKIKTEASGYPSWVKSEDDKNQYISQIKKKTGIALEKDKILSNPALRSLSKICLNSFWGKLAQKNNKMKCKLISSTADLEKLKNNSELSINRLHIVNEDILVVEYNNAEGFEEDSKATNEIIAAFTTCYGRLELLKHIDAVGDGIMYCDTDSIIFLTRKISHGDSPDNYDIYPKLGDSLGELSNELAPGKHITRFSAIAPKSYAYRCNDETEICKFKGITLNFLNSQRINFQAVTDLLYGEVESISLQPQTQFARQKYEGVIFNVDLVKSVKPTFNKRRILPNFDTLPFGYKATESESEDG